MKARSESIRAQLELPLFQRSLPFAVLSVFVLMPLSVLWSLFAALRLLRSRIPLCVHTQKCTLILSTHDSQVVTTSRSHPIRNLEMTRFLRHKTIS